MKLNFLAIGGLLFWMIIMSLIVLDIVVEIEEIREATAWYEQHMYKIANEGYYEVEFD